MLKKKSLFKTALLIAMNVMVCLNPLAATELPGTLSITSISKIFNR